jgi:hypothetical protein
VGTRPASVRWSGGASLACFRPALVAWVRQERIVEDCFRQSPLAALHQPLGELVFLGFDCKPESPQMRIHLVVRETIDVHPDRLYAAARESSAVCRVLLLSREPQFG